MKDKKITVDVNDVLYTRTVQVCETLAEFLRSDLYLTGTKIGCNEGECGACTVLLDGVPVNSCLVLAVETDGKKVLTVEGLSGNELHPLQQAFLDVGAVQCGFCTPGMLLSAKAVLDHNPHPTEAEVRKGIEGNICRCTGYNRIIQAVLLAAERIKKSAE
jgi:carbon-monoxide dehydrogenase small subunit